MKLFRFAFEVFGMMLLIPAIIIAELNNASTAASAAQSSIEAQVPASITPQVVEKPVQLKTGYPFAEGIYTVIN